MRKIRRHRFSRYPISEKGDPDHVAGYVYVKDLLMAVRPPRGGLQDLKRDILYVPESRTVGDLLQQFQESKIPIALVVDEYGGTAGLVTLEDVLEEIVGDIQNELGVNEPRMSLVADGTMVVDGSLPIDELDLDGMKAPPIEGAETVGGYIVATLGRLAEPGDRITLGRWEAIVEDVRDRRVQRVALVGADSPRSTLPPPENAEKEG
jgi:putative hemolysin